MIWRVGCCGFPKARATYRRHLRAVEVQQTFYRLPRTETLERWRREAGPGFVFTLKAWQGITHPASSPTYRRLGRPLTPEEREGLGYFRDHPAVWAGWAATRRAAEILQAEVVLLQCPASFRPTDENVARLDAFLSRLGPLPFRLAWEPRGAWPDEVIADLCARHGLIHAVDPLARAPVTGDVAYFRLHGRTGYRYRHTDADLEEILERARGFDVAYVFFNNAAMWEDALRFAERVGVGGAAG